MPTSADNILSYLPPAFAPLPRPTALSAIADAFGGELLDAENALAAVMFAHWVDYADANADAIGDLASIAALYGLAPRDDETIEGFRAHLKRYVRTFIEGTTTVRGICRIVAEALGVVIADDRLDEWWSRANPVLATVDDAADDAAARLFGVPNIMVRGHAAQRAVLGGGIVLAQPLDLRGASVLRVRIDGAPAVNVDLAAHLDPANATLAGVVAALGGVAGLAATADGGRLVLRTASAGAASTLELEDVAGDAAPALLGIAPREYRGRDAVRAAIGGTVDLPPAVDLTTNRYLRLTIDCRTAYEIDCAGAAPNATTPAEAVAAIVAEAGAGTASLAGARLVVSSPALGLAGTIAVNVPASGDAAALLLGAPVRYVRGDDAAPARVDGGTDLSAGVDLSARANLHFAIDAFAPLIVNCAGAVPQRTSAGEIANAINAAVGLPVATQNGTNVTLTSRVTGPASRVRLLTAPAGDALDLIFGFAPRIVHGADASAAHVTGTADLSAGADLRALGRVRIAVDDAAPVTVDFAAAGLARSGVTAQQIASAIDAALGAPVAGTDGTHLALTSGAPGTQGSVAIVPIETVRERRFVSRAFSLDEASNTVLGTFAASATGSSASAGALAGTVDLHDGLDLRAQRYLRIAVDGAPPVDVDAAQRSARPRAAMLADVVAAIGAKLAPHAVASLAGDRLVLTSRTAGPASAVVLAANGGDAARTIFGADALEAIGSAARRVVFTGVADLSQGVDLGAHDRVSIAVDGAAPVEIACAGFTPAKTSANEIVARLNSALSGTFASTDGTFVRVSSGIAGHAGSVAFLAPAAGDATRAVFGIPAGRTYRGDDATSAQLAGAHDLPAAVDLSAAPFVRLAIDGGTPVLVDCSGADTAKTTPAEIAAKIAAALPAAAATVALHGARVAVTSKSAGPVSRVALLASPDGDASTVLFGTAVPQPGSAGLPATVRGTVDLRTPVDLSRRSSLRIAVDGGRALDVDVSGAAPDRTFGDEIVAALDLALPGLASLDAKGALVLTSPSAGDASTLDVLPLRPFEVIEYPLGDASFGPVTVVNGGTFTLENDGATDASVAFEIEGGGGLAGVELINLTSGYRVRVDAASDPNRTLRIAAGDGGRVVASVADRTGSVRYDVAANDVVATPLAVSAVVPFESPRALGTSGPGKRPALALFDPLAHAVVLLEALGAAGAARTAVTVVAADPHAASAPPAASPGPLELVGRMHANGGRGDLLDANGVRIVRVRAGAGVEFAPFDGRVVIVRGAWHPDEPPPLLAVTWIAQLFDVTIGAAQHRAVALDPRAGARGLAAQLAVAGGTVIARELRPADALALPRGRSTWTIVQCDGSRFETARFDDAFFAGGPCARPGIFDVSRFDDDDDPSGSALFGPLGAIPPVTVRASWQTHRAGAFSVNLPADLPARFGARFNESRFASASGAGETYDGVVLDPPNDAQNIVNVLNASKLVRASVVDRAPLGWDAQRVPFHVPRSRALSGGRADRPAAMYLFDPEVPGVFAIRAVTNGAWGDGIAISVRYGGPAQYDLGITYAAARFESARAIAYAGRVLGPGEDPLPALVAKIIAPQPVGVVQAKAAGIRADVTRERT